MPRIEAKEPYPNFRQLEAYRLHSLRLMNGVRKSLIEEGLTTDAAQIHKGWDLHSFFPRTDDPNRVIHLQLYIRVPARPTIDLKIREMDGSKIEEARKLASIGAEESAVTKNIIPRSIHFYSGYAIKGLLEQVLEMP